MSHRLALILAALALVSSLVEKAAPAIAAESIRLELRCGAVQRQDAAVSVEVPAAARSWKAFELTDEDANRAVPVQLDPGERPRLVWILSERLGPGQTRHYRLARRESSQEGASAVSARREPQSLRVDLGGRPLSTRAVQGGHDHSLVCGQERARPGNFPDVLSDLQDHGDGTERLAHSAYARRFLADQAVPQTQVLVPAACFHMANA